MKKRLTQSEEFEILKIVLDKFLWIGVIIMGFGLYKILQENNVTSGLTIIVTGAIILVLFLILVVKEYEIIS